MALCDDCREALDKWYDFRGPINLGIKIAQSGNPHANVPSFVRTHEVVASNVKRIKDRCAAEHQVAIVA